MRVADASEADFQAWAAGGDARRAAEWLVHRYADEVMGLCMAMVRDRSAAEDLAQDVFGRAFFGLSDFRGDASSRTWLLRIAKNRCIDHLRAERREIVDAEREDEVADEHPDTAPLPPDLLSRREDVEAAIAELAEVERALIVLRFRNGLDYDELAVAFGLREGTVRMRMSRALAKMRRALEARDAADIIPAAASFSAAMPGAPRRAAPAPAPAPAVARGGFGARLRDLFRSDVPPPAEANPPIEHPLAAYFAATRQALSDALRARLLERAQAL